MEIEELEEEAESYAMLKAEGFDEAIIGICRRAVMTPVLAYSRKKCIEILARDMDWHDAEEYFEYNVIGAYVGEMTPVFITFLERNDDERTEDEGLQEGDVPDSGAMPEL